MNQQYQQEDHYDYNLEEDLEEIIEPVKEKKKYTPIWAWIPFLASLVCYMFVYLFLLNAVIDSTEIDNLFWAAGFLIPAFGLEYLVRNKMNQDSMILKSLRWLMIIIYGSLTLLFIIGLFMDSTVLHFPGILGLSGIIGMVVALIYQIKNNN